jgi:hypothetical protein
VSVRVCVCGLRRSCRCFARVCVALVRGRPTLCAAGLHVAGSPPVVPSAAAMR